MSLLHGIHETAMCNPDTQLIDDHATVYGSFFAYETVFLWAFISTSKTIRAPAGYIKKQCEDLAV